MEAQLENARVELNRIKACQGDFSQLQSDLTLSRKHNTELSVKIAQIQVIFTQSTNEINGKLEIMMKEKHEEEQIRVLKDDELKEKDIVIKRLTQENLTQKQRLTQIE